MTGPWPPERIAALEKLWLEGATSLAIGQQLHMSKSAVIGKAHRLGLPPRPSPITRKDPASTSPIQQRTRRARRAYLGKPTLPPMAAPVPDAPPVPAVPPPLPVAAVAPSPVVSAVPPPPPPLPIPVPVAAPPPAAPVTVAKPAPATPRPIRIGRVRECCWPIGEPGSRGFRFCDAATEPGRPYCATHGAVAYLRPRATDAAARAADAAA